MSVFMIRSWERGKFGFVVEMAMVWFGESAWTSARGVVAPTTCGWRRGDVLA